MALSTLTELKIVFAGPMGAGKTTAIQAVSSIETLRTEVENNDQDQFPKPRTTVALDYGELSLKEGLVLKLFGTPGQSRFSFMWRSLARGALGLVILVDNSRPSPLQDLAEFLTGFHDLACTGRVVVGIGRMEGHWSPSIEEFTAVLTDFGVVAPAIAVDARRREDVVLLLEMLFAQIEFDGVLDGGTAL